MNFMNISRLRPEVLRFASVGRNLGSFRVGTVLKPTWGGFDSVVVPLDDPEEKGRWVALCPISDDRKELEPLEIAYNIVFVEENYVPTGEVIDLARFRITV